MSHVWIDDGVYHLDGANAPVNPLPHPMDYVSSLIHSTWSFATLSSALGQSGGKKLKSIMKNSNLNENDQISLHTQKDVASLALRIYMMIPINQSVLSFAKFLHQIITTK